MLFSKTADREKLNLLCFPYAGGNADFYNRWNGPELEGIVVHPVQLPGRGQHINMPLVTRMALMTELLADELHHFQGCRFALLGTSMGGWLIYQLAQQLKQLGDAMEPECLVICSSAHPAFRKYLPQINDTDPNTAIKRLGEFNPACLEVLHNPELASLFLPILQADFALCRSWQFDPSLIIDCPILAFHGRQDRIVDQGMMRPWKDLTSGSFRLASVEGDHFFTEHPPVHFLGELRQLLLSTSQQPA
ncbi:thioesterase II family protein [Pseudomonas sp. NPDC089554]|uniref:thioesterase II family protein n=1 Tax=Pseudomonas sp. NPDC089554 TaxID=3390653 RepID=UPI003D00A197